MRAKRYSFGLVPALLFLSGCGQNGITVSGKVTVDGSPISSGSISFMPVDTKTGQAVGGQIVDGSYKVNGVSVGKQRVNVSVNPKMDKASVSEQMAKSKLYMQYEHSRGKKGEKPPPSELAHVIGNDQIHEIAAGSSQVLNFDLHKMEGPEPDRRKR